MQLSVSTEKVILKKIVNNNSKQLLSSFLPSTVSNSISFTINTGTQQADEHYFITTSYIEVSANALFQGNSVFNGSATFNGPVNIPMPQFPLSINGNLKFNGDGPPNTPLSNSVLIGNTTNGGFISIQTNGSDITLNPGSGFVFLQGLKQPTGVVYSILVDSFGKLYASTSSLSSSRRFKTTIEPLLIEESSQIYLLKPQKFSYKETPEKKEFGLIAEDLLDEKILLNTLEYDFNHELSGINYQAIFVAMLNEFIKLKNEHDELKLVVKEIQKILSSQFNYDIVQSIQ